MQTQLDLVKKYQLSIRGVSGQHLLIDPNIQRKIVEVLKPQPGETILEIGPGLGALTHEMIAREARVLAIEKDAKFVEVLTKEIDSKYLDVLAGDILEQDFARLFEEKKISPPIQVVSNLPYYITAPILFHLFESADYFSRGVFMLQKEVAMRLAAGPGTKDYGRLSLAAKYYGQVSQLFPVAPGCFTPQPQVGSAVIKCVFHDKHLRWNKMKEQKLFKIVKIAFSERRKTLMHLLLKNFGNFLDRPKLQTLFAKLGFENKVRGEELLLKDFMTLTETLMEVGCE